MEKATEKQVAYLKILLKESLGQDEPDGVIVKLVILDEYAEMPVGGRHSTLREVTPEFAPKIRAAVLEAANKIELSSLTKTEASQLISDLKNEDFIVNVAEQAGIKSQILNKFEK